MESFLTRVPAIWNSLFGSIIDLTGQIPSVDATIKAQLPGGEWMFYLIEGNFSLNGEVFFADHTHKTEWSPSAGTW